MRPSGEDGVTLRALATLVDNIAEDLRQRAAEMPATDAMATFLASWAVCRQAAVLREMDDRLEQELWDAATSDDDRAMQAAERLSVRLREDLDGIGGPTS